MAITIDPSLVIKQRFAGASDMGNVQDDDDPIRFGLDKKFLLLWIRGLFSGGTSSATLNIKLRHADRRGWVDATSDGLFDYVEAVILTVGTDGTSDPNWLVLPDEYHRYVYEAGDKLVPEWTNPNTQKWSLEVGLYEL